MLEFPEVRGTPGGELVYFDDGYKPFVEKVRAAIEQIEGTDIGARMMREIRDARRSVRVLRYTDNSCKLTQVEQCDAACYREVLSDDAIHAALLAVACDKRLCDTPEVGHAFRKLKSAANVERLRTSQDAVNLPKFKLNELQRGKIGYWLMEHLVPGDGAGATVRWGPDITHVMPAGADNPPTWSERPPWIALAHELIHAWRMVTGRLVFHPRTEMYHEEAMTVGLPPYDRCPFTENRFRERAHQARRSYYGITSQAKTEKAVGKYGWPDYT